MNVHAIMLEELVSFNERRSFEKSRNAPATLYALRRELRALTQKAQALPVSQDVVLRKIELTLPPVLHNELGALREVLISKNLRVC